jgi:hypothetical protein
MEHAVIILVRSRLEIPVQFSLGFAGFWIKGVVYIDVFAHSGGLISF